MSRSSDAELLAAAGSDPDAFEAFYRRHVQEIVSYAARRSSTPEEVADLVAATFVKVIESADRYDPARGEPIAWLHGIAANVLAGRRRRDRREQAALRRLSGRRLLDEDDHARLEEMIDAARLAPVVESAIAELPESQRVVVDLVREGLSPTDAAHELSISAATARMRLSRARRSLTRSLDVRPEPSENHPALKEER